MIDFTQNNNQASYFNEVMKAVTGQTSNRFFAYGGSVRSGKTYATLGIIALFANRLFPGSHWHIIRKDFTVLAETTIPSMEKILPPAKNAKWQYKRSAGTYHIKFQNGSEIHFKGENYIQDKDLNDFLGLETNGLVLEQAEELSERLLQRALERTGSWYMSPMPPGFVFLTFNPTENWVKNRLYDKFVEGKLESPWYYQPALPTDNPFVTQDQWDSWKQMDEVDYRRFIQGDWDALRKGGEFYIKFSRIKHTGLVEFDPMLPVHLAFDQNVVPYITMTCHQVRYQDGLMLISQFDEFCLSSPDNTSEALGHAFYNEYGHKMKSIAYLYGDASGNKRGTTNVMTDYDILKRALYKVLINESDRTNRSNPAVVKRRNFINNLFAEKYNVRILLDSDKCRETIKDLDKVKQDMNGHKLKERGTDSVTGITFEKYGHCSDSLDYFYVTILEDLWLEFLNY